MHFKCRKCNRLAGQAQPKGKISRKADFVPSPLSTGRDPIGLASEAALHDLLPPLCPFASLRLCVRFLSV
jgi:hypothetical protein